MAMYEGKLGEALTPREIAILELYAEGHWRTEIAAELSLTSSTIKKYEARIRKKLGARHTLQAMALAYHKHVLVNPVVVEVNRLFHVNRPQALACWNLAFQLPMNASFEITDQDNYGALIAEAGGQRWKLPTGGGVVELTPIEPVERS